MPRVKIRQTPKMRKLSKTDWYGYPGAESFEDGVEPYIGDVQIKDWPERDVFKKYDSSVTDESLLGLTVIADRNGIWIGGFNCFLTLDLESNPSSAFRVFLANAILSRVWLVSELVDVSFEKINWEVSR